MWRASVAIISPCRLSRQLNRHNRMATILVVDDELGIRDLLFEILNDEGHQVELAMNAAQARSIRATLQPDLVLLDIWMPDTDGVTLLKEWATTGLLTMPVVMMSGHATIDTAVEATRIGAMAFLEKPVTMQKLLKAVEQGLNRKWAGAGRGAALPQTSGTTHSNLGMVSVTPSVSPVLPAVLQPVQSFDLSGPLREARDSFEKAYFEFHLAQEGGSMTRVAEKTGLERTHLYRKLKQLGVDLSRGKRFGSSQ
jgi:DNA-binding NtrC family response regulator